MADNFKDVKNDDDFYRNQATPEDAMRVILSTIKQAKRIAARFNLDWEKIINDPFLDDEEAIYPPV